ncbi:MAG: FAD:protein transferase [Gaiellaceae bacterium]|nr:FAD:protein transferase [Gaiellaceae bacterium]
MIRRFRSMGCEVVVGGATPLELGRVAHLFRERDRRFSRFRPTSELNAVNARSGELVRVSEDFAAVLRLALELAAETDGLVDPTLGAALEAAGYDRDFAELGDDPRPLGQARAGAWQEVRLAGRLLRCPPGVLLDLNGVVKGATVDEALALLAGDGFVAAGGDLAARGPVTVALPGGGAVELREGGLATSGASARRWRRGGVEQHHLIDPSTGRPAESPWREVSVCGATCLAADVAAKAAFLAGPRWLEERNLPGRFVAASGTVLTTPAWTAEREPACT